MTTASERVRAWKEANRDKVRAWNRAWAKAHREAHREQVNESMRAWRKAHPEEVAAGNRARRAELRELVARLKGTTCTCCGKEFPSRQLHFHHVDPATKLFSVAAAIPRRLGAATIRAEVAKCEVLCRSCHDQRHKED